MVHLFFRCKLTDLENVSFDQTQPSEASLGLRDFEKKHVTTETKRRRKRVGKMPLVLTEHTQKTFQIF